MEPLGPELTPNWLQLDSTLEPKIMEKNWDSKKLRKAFEENKTFRKRESIKARRKFIVGMYAQILTRPTQGLIKRTMRVLLHKLQYIRLLHISGNLSFFGWKSSF